MTKILRIDTEKPDARGVKQIVEVLRNDGIIVYPTDSVYTLGGNIYSSEVFKKLCRLKDIPEKKAQFSIVCSDFSHVSNFAKQLSNNHFNIMKQYLPGAFTFIIEGNKMANKIFQHNKKTIGVRIPNMPLVKQIIETLDAPIFSASIQLHSDSPYVTTAEEIMDEYQHKVDLIIDGGLCGEKPTTIVDLTSEPISILRQGAGAFLYDE